MNIDPASTIGGAPAVKVRDALRRLWDDSSFGADDLASTLGDDGNGDEVLAGLVEEAFAEHVDGGPSVGLTPAGVRLRNATARRPVSREVADRHLSAFLERVEEVNGDDDLLYLVDRVTLFGSMLDASVAKVSDVDLCVDLSPRYPEEHTERSRARSAEAESRGRRFSNLIERVSWPQREVELMLKARSPVLSIGIGPEERVISEGERRRVIYERPGIAASS